MSVYKAVRKSKDSKAKKAKKVPENKQDKLKQQSIIVGHISSLMMRRMKKSSSKVEKLSITAEVHGLDDKEVQGFTQVLKVLGYDFSELREEIEGHSKYKAFLKKYMSDALDNYFPGNYVPDAAEFAKARIDIGSQVDESKYGIIIEFLEKHCKEMHITFKV